MNKETDTLRKSLITGILLILLITVILIIYNLAQIFGKGSLAHIFNMFYIKEITNFYSYLKVLITLTVSIFVITIITEYVINKLVGIDTRFGSIVVILHLHFILLIIFRDYGFWNLLFLYLGIYVLLYILNLILNLISYVFD